MTSLTDLLPAGAALHVSAHADNKVLTLHDGAWTEFGLPGARGIAACPTCTCVATDDGIVHFNQDGRKAATTHLKGLQAHELVADDAGDLYVVAAAHSTVYRVSILGDLEAVYVPRGTDPGTTDHRSHLNGVGTRDGKLAYVTTLGLSNTQNGWREEAAASRGLLLDAATGDALVIGLLMPHTPRVHNGAVYLLNSGHGQLLRWQPGDSTATVVATLSGFARGMLILGDHAIVGVSQGRITAIPTLTTDPLAQPGLAVINLTTGEQEDFVSLDVQEVFDVALGTAPLAE